MPEEEKKEVTLEDAIESLRKLRDLTRQTIVDLSEVFEGGVDGVINITSHLRGSQLEGIEEMRKKAFDTKIQLSITGELMRRVIENNRKEEVNDK